ncbi:MAG: hypothetical protein ACK4GN_13230 [Runella sp.]
MPFTKSAPYLAHYQNWLTALELNVSFEFPFVEGQENPMDVIYPTFVTLTLPCKQIHDDRDIKEDCFHPFMAEMQRCWRVKNYVWVSETQKNGNLHFHVLMDRAVPAKRLRQIWNKHIDKFPYCYVEDYGHTQRYIYRNGFKFRKDMLEKRLEKERLRYRAEGRWLRAKDIAVIKKKEEKRQREAYEKGMKEGWKDPNSTDIHSLENIRKLTAYVTKYFTKKPEIVKPQLPDNQKLVEISGKYYIETTPDPDQEVMWGQSNLKPYTPTFTTRKMDGRIWGASATLKNPDTKPTYYTCTVRNTVIEEVVMAEKKIVQVKVPIAEQMSIGGQVKVIRATQQKEILKHKPPKQQSSVEVNNAALAYLIALKEQVVSAKEVEIATASVGEHFKAIDGEVIPLREPQRHYLSQYSAEMWAEYRAHYTQVFQTLYSIAA